MNRIVSERIKSVDALNVKLMRDNAPEVAPDMSQYKATEKKHQIITDMRAQSRAMDMLMLQKTHPHLFRNRVVMNEPSAPVDESAA
jgi:hypothetical protein